MTNIERIRMARQEMDETFKRLIKDSHGQSSVGPADLEVLQHHVIAMIAAQVQALVQATQVADENFDRAQKLSEQVQENVKHIERMADDIQAISWMLEQKGYKAQRNAFGHIDSFVRTSHVVVMPPG